MRPALHIFLCTFQCALWQSELQYFASLQVAHCFNSVLALPHSKHDMFIGKAVFKRPLSKKISFKRYCISISFFNFFNIFFAVSNRGPYIRHGGFLAVRQLQPRGAGTRLPETCTIRTALSVRVRRASFHLIRWLLSATNASAAPLLCHRTAIKRKQCGPIFRIGPHFVPQRDIKKVSFKDCFSMNVSRHLGSAIRDTRYALQPAQYVNNTLYP